MKPPEAAELAKAAELLRAAGWEVTPPPDPEAPCSFCGKDWRTVSCAVGGCPLGADW